MGSRKKKGRKQKNRAYFMRYQPKMRRRRQCKTDYQARKTLIVQDKNKYNTPKYRFVVRITNKDVICQLVSSKVVGDEVHCAAYSHELPRYGLKVGLTNYAACYCTGLLLARRLLKLKGLDEAYEGQTEVNGEYFCEEFADDEDFQKAPFVALLDVGLRRTTTGSRVYAAMKGAVDGGLAIPHGDSGKQFPGWKSGDGDDGGEEYNAGRCAEYIFGGHVGDYMDKLKEEDEDKYAKHFARYTALGLDSEKLEGLYKKVHAAIRENPAATQKKAQDKKQKSKYTKSPKKSKAEKRDHIVNKILVLRSKKE